MHNLGTVFSFEFLRTIKKPTFWISIILFPAMIAVIAGISYASNKTTENAAEQSKNDKFTLEITDESGLLTQQVLTAVGATRPSDKAIGIANVQAGRVDAYFYYPKDISSDKIEVFAKDSGVFDNSKYDAVAKELLNQSVAGLVGSNVKAVLAGTVNVSVTTYKDGTTYDGLKSMIVPGIFLVLFYFVIAMFGNQMLNSTVEEKENRVIEMLLTSVETRTLIIGKILALVTLGLLQIFLIIIPVIIGYFAVRTQLSLPNFDLSMVTFDWGRIAVGFLFFILSFLFFTGVLVTIGASVPTAKEAGPFMGATVLLLFAPLYAASLFISNPESTIVQFLTYFPLTAPIPLLLRNAVGNLQPQEALLSLIILAISTVIIINMAVRVFRYGALEYSRKLSLKEILGR